MACDCRWYLSAFYSQLEVKAGGHHQRESAIFLDCLQPFRQLHALLSLCCFMRFSVGTKQSSPLALLVLWQRDRLEWGFASCLALMRRIQSCPTALTLAYWEHLNPAHKNVMEKLSIYMAHVMLICSSAITMIPMVGHPGSHCTYMNDNILAKVL